jgi:AraC-like DNA-binding protein
MRETLQHSKLCFAESGGIFFSRNIKTEFNSNRLFSLLISLSGSIRIAQNDSGVDSARAILISPNIEFKNNTSPDDLVAFVHIDPFSPSGLKIRRSQSITVLPDGGLRSLNDQLLRCYSSDVEESVVDDLVDRMVQSLPVECLESKEIDTRIIECINMLNDAMSVNMKELSNHAVLSPSRLSHLFKQETSISMRQYIQHRKVIVSIKGIYRKQNLTEAAMFGGFSDQPHFNKTFKSMFGIRPSRVHR